MVFVITIYISSNIKLDALISIQTNATIYGLELSSVTFIYITITRYMYMYEFKF